MLHFIALDVMSRGSYSQCVSLVRDVVELKRFLDGSLPSLALTKESGQTWNILIYCKMSPTGSKINFVNFKKF